jgi:hypothetical protein
MAEDPMPSAEAQGIDTCPDCLQRVGHDLVVVRGRGGISTRWHRTCLKRRVDARVAALGENVEDACRKDPILAWWAEALYGESRLRFTTRRDWLATD